ncbi:MAG: hypothetical protein HZC41_21750 [Chloroflexi bacterium]|nr:hypothetical protein [Chloroflexota bacterium]
MLSLDDLLNSIFEQSASTLRPEFEAWVRESKAFRAFAETYQGKIRKKIRTAPGEDGLKDVRLELETARCLLSDKRFTLQYEPLAAGKTCGPDFAVTFRSAPFHLEVTRLRPVGEQTGEGNITRLTETLGDKTGQMPAGAVNVLFIAAEMPVTAADLAAAGKRLKTLADTKQEQFFIRHGYDDAADFLRQYRHLSAVLVRCPPDHPHWLNSLARHPLPKDLLLALQKLLTPGRT